MLFVDLSIGLIILFIVVGVITAIEHIRFVTPYVPTPVAIGRTMVDLADLRGTETVYDLGAGDGTLLRLAKKSSPAIRAEGFEIALAVWLWGKLKIALSGLPIKLFWKNGLRENLADADVIFLYLGPDMMKKCESKFDAELRPGTKVISHAFSFPGKKPVREVIIPWGRRQKKVLLYVW